MTPINRPLFLAPTASVMGQVFLQERVTIWYSAVIRADVEEIWIGSDTNIQDGAVIHADPGDPTRIGQGVTIGHGAIVHGATIGDYSLVGMRATILNQASVGKFCVIGAHALVKEKQIVPDYSLVVGLPAEVIRTFDVSIERKLIESAQHYVEMGIQHAAGRFPRWI